MHYFIVIGLFIFNFSSVLTRTNKKPDLCLDLIDEFSFSISMFTKCSADNARPINVCSNCIYEYIGILNSFNNLTKVSVNKTLCIDKYINFDRLGVVETIKNNAVNLWNKANCDDCYTIENKTLTDLPSKFRRQFDNYRANFSACVNWNKNENDTVLCKKCLDTYIAMNNYYFDVGGIKDGINGICMDVVDWMNITQLDWSDRCCKYRKHKEYTLIFVVTFICFLPVIFYFSARYFGDTKRRIILFQNRFAESINAQSQSSINR